MKYKFGLLIWVFLSNMVLANSESARWVKGNHIVKDRVLGLVWQDTRSVTFRKKDWNAAKYYCEKLNLRSENNWRLPTLVELLSIIDYTKTSPALDKTFEYSPKEGYLWSVSRVSTDERYAWYIAIDKGNTYAYSKEEEAYFRCVRDEK